MASDDSPDLIAKLARANTDGEVLGRIRGALWALEQVYPCCELGEHAAHFAVGELLRQHSHRNVERELGRVKNRELAAYVTRRLAEHANAETRPIDPAELEPESNSPTDIGGRDLPGGWTGGQATPTTTTKRRVRREDNR